MLFAQKMVAPIRLCRGKQGHLGWQCRRGDTQLAGSAGARCDSRVWGDRVDPLCQGAGGTRSTGMGTGVGAAPGKSHRDGDIACVCRKRTMRHIPGVVSHHSSALALLHVLCSAQAVPGPLPMKNHQHLPFPAYDTSHFTSLSLGPSVFSQLFPFLIFQALVFTPPWTPQRDPDPRPVSPTTAAHPGSPPAQGRKQHHRLQAAGR